MMRRIALSTGVELDVLDAGDGRRGAVVLLHGFPESSHSWRHQIEPLASAGWRVIVPDQRGYAGSSTPDSVEAYRADHLSDDIAALLDAVGVDQAVIVGHDWGAIVTWHIGQRHPDRCRAIVTASVPWTPWPAPPTDVLRAQHGDNFFYILYFQIREVPERELDADPRRFILSIAHMASGDGMHSLVGGPMPAEGTRLTDYFEQAIGGRRLDVPQWMSEADLDTYTDQFIRSGFFGPISWYRNLDANHEIFTPIGATPLTMPTFFIAGDLDPVILGRPGYVERMDDDLPNHRDTVLLPGIGHWVQQEDPDGFNRVLLGWLDSL
ncbi:MAG: alpha/beta hydrolase [Actinomycetota bacterium]|nr:alpha/beta hydrolase [Actinomycetota bacterium]